MLNDLELLKSTLGVTADDLNLTESSFNAILDRSAKLAYMFLSERFNLADENLKERAPLAEVNLIRAILIEEFGILDTVSPTEIKTGGPDGQSVKYIPLSTDDRLKKSAGYRERAMRIMGAGQPVIQHVF